MGVIYPNDWSEAWAPQTTLCGYCGHDVDTTVVNVVWSHNGDGAVLPYHVRCSERIGTHLLGDAREAILASARDHFWTQRCARALGSALLTEERAS